MDTLHMNESPAPEREPTPDELALLREAFARVELHPDELGSTGERVTDERTCESTAEFLRAVRSLDATLEGRFRRRSRPFRAALRRRVHAEGLVEHVGREGYVLRGVGLAFQYARLRLRESRALRVAALLLVVHLLAVPVAALIVRAERDRETRTYRIDLVRDEVPFGLVQDDEQYDSHEDVPAEEPQTEEQEPLGH